MPRKICEQCQRPQQVCICEHLVSLTAPCEIIILQHPTEQKQALATVPILQACINNLTVLVGEEFTNHPRVLQLLDHADQLAVIFPNDDAMIWDINKHSELASNKQAAPKALIVLDGTWRKAKLIWHKNPWLQSLPNVSLAGLPESQYMIRSSTVQGGVSTLEAVMHCCNFLTQSQDYGPLLNPFKAMIEWQIKKMGKETFLAHYQK